MIHLPTGIIETAQCRSRENSYAEAFTRLSNKVKTLQFSEIYKERSTERKQQIGSGMRGDKIRTYRFQDNTAVDHRNNKKISLDKILNGDFKLLW